MELRPELTPQVVSPSRIAELRHAIEAIASQLERGDPADSAIAAFNADTGHDYRAYDFLSFWGFQSVAEFATEAARPAWPKVADVSPDELAEVVRRMQAADRDSDYYVLLLRANVVHPGVIDLIFNPPPELADASPETIVEAALAYRPVAL